MPSNNGGLAIGRLVGMFPGRIGWLLSPDATWKNPPSWLPYALDNGAYSAWKNKTPFCPRKAYGMIEKSIPFHDPKWFVVPDVVTDKDATIKSWYDWEPHLRKNHPGLSLAFAVQDGMEVADVPKSADIIFVGGSFDWKWETIPMWCNAFERVHVARVNTLGKLRVCDLHGVESCDGTGWTRGGEIRLFELEQFLTETAGA